MSLNYFPTLTNIQSYITHTVILTAFSLCPKSTWWRQLRLVQSRVWSSWWRGCRSSCTSVTRTRSPTSNCWSCSSCWSHGCTTGKDKTTRTKSVSTTRAKLQFIWLVISFHVNTCSLLLFTLFTRRPNELTLILANWFVSSIDSCHTISWLWRQQIHNHQTLEPTDWWESDKSL